MTLPLVVLAAGAVVAGWVGIPAGLWHAFGLPTRTCSTTSWPRWSPSCPERAAERRDVGRHCASSRWMLASGGWSRHRHLLAAPLVGWPRPGPPTRHSRQRPRARAAAAENKYWVDEIYDRLVVPAPARSRARLLEGGRPRWSSTVRSRRAFVTELTGDLRAVHHDRQRPAVRALLPRRRGAACSGG